MVSIVNFYEYIIIYLCILLLISILFIIEVLPIYNIVLVPDVQQSDWVIDG